MPLLILALRFIVQILLVLIIIDVVASYFARAIPQYHPLLVLVRRITRPVVAPFRKILPPQRMGEVYIDFSPMLAMFALMLIQRLLLSIRLH